MSETFFVVPVAVHESLVSTAYKHRGFDAAEADHAEVNHDAHVHATLGPRCP